jgi:hypothetical protein
MPSTDSQSPRTAADSDIFIDRFFWDYSDASEMAQNRYDELKGALYQRIRGKKFVDDRALLTWLVFRLDEWVECLDPGAFSWQRIIQTDFFGMLMANIEMIDEVKSTTDLKERLPEREWREFRNAVMRLEKTRDREEAALVEKTYHRFKDRFAAISGQNSNDDRELGPQFDSKTTRTDGKQVSAKTNRRRSNPGLYHRKLNGGHVQICCHESNSGPQG